MGGSLGEFSRAKAKEMKVSPPPLHKGMLEVSRGSPMVEDRRNLLHLAALSRPLPA
jgi:hypothetical protein